GAARPRAGHSGHPGPPTTAFWWRVGTSFTFVGLPIRPGFVTLWTGCDAAPDRSRFKPPYSVVMSISDCTAPVNARGWLLSKPTCWIGRLHTVRFKTGYRSCAGRAVHVKAQPLNSSARRRQSWRRDHVEVAFRAARKALRRSASAYAGCRYPDPD